MSQTEWEQSRPASDLNPFAAPAHSDSIPENREGVLLATLWQRFVGAFVDGIMAGVMMLFGVFLIFLQGPTPGENPAIFFTILYIPLAVVFLGQAYLVSVYGRSVGKFAIGTKIVLVEDGSLPGYLRGGFLRQILPVLISAIPFVGVLFGIVDVLCIFGKERRTLHDYMAGTRVIQTN